MRVRVQVFNFISTLFLIQYISSKMVVEDNINVQLFFTPGKDVIVVMVKVDPELFRNTGIEAGLLPGLPSDHIHMLIHKQG